MYPKNHWENVYSSKGSEEVSWYQQRAERALELISIAGIDRSEAIIDVGGGASMLVDDLLAQGYSNVTVLDVAGAALEVARKRLGDKSADVRWLETDILEAELPEAGYDLWHDRAVFHFLTAVADRQAYVEAARRALKPGGYGIVATFAEDGPAQCSGLPVMRYRPPDLLAEFGDDFVLADQKKETHSAPSGAEQNFIYCLIRKTGPR